MKNSIKNITKVSICALIIFFSLGNVYAESSCNVEMKVSANKIKKGEALVAEININEIKSEMGIMAFGATLNYDKESLEIEKIEGLNEWETPIVGVSYNEETGKIAITKNGFGKQDESIMKITFVAKKESKKNANVILKDISLSDGTALITTSDIVESITVKDGKSKFLRNLIIIVVIIVALLFFVKLKRKKTKKNY